VKNQRLFQKRQLSKTPSGAGEDVVMAGDASISDPAHGDFAKSASNCAQ